MPLKNYKSNVKKQSTVPGPYLESPPQELSRNFMDKSIIDREGDEGDEIYFNASGSDDIPEINLEDNDQCQSDF